MPVLWPEPWRPGAGTIAGRAIEWAATRLTTKRAVVEEGLRLLVQLRAQSRIRSLRGKAKWEGNLRRMRARRVRETLPVVIVDSTVWIDYLNGVAASHTDWIHREVDRQRLGLIDLILCEVLRGLRDERQFRQVLSRLMAFEVFDSGGRDLAIATAQNVRALRARGRTVRATIDGWIATFCMRHGHALLHNDRDFDSFEERLGLEVIHP